MPDEFDVEGGDILEAESSPREAKDGKGSEPEQPARTVTPEDLDRLRSVKDRETAEAKRLAAQTAAENRRLQAQVQATQQGYDELIATIQSINPDSADAIVLNQRLRQLETENATYREELQYTQQVQQFRSYHENAARAAGIDPYEARYQEALTQAQLSGDVLVIEKAKAAILRDEFSKETQMAGTPRDPEREERAQRLKAAEQDGSLDMLPPGGGQPGTAEDRLMADYKSDIAKAQGNVTRVFEIKQKYRKLNLDV